MLVTPVRPVVSMNVMDAQLARKLLRILVMPWVFVRITCPVGQGAVLDMS